MATGAAPMRPKGGLIRDLLEGSFPELYPAPTPTPEPEEKEEAAEAEAEETTDESPDEKETASLSEADASEKEPEVDDAVPETGSYRPPTPDLDAYAKRIAEIDAEVNTRTSFPDREDTRRWSTTQNGCPLSFFPRFSQSTQSTFAAVQALTHHCQPSIATQKKGGLPSPEPGCGINAPGVSDDRGGGGGTTRAGRGGRDVHSAPPAHGRASPRFQP
jgi:hypothetical protein|tara:strand:+ start:1091 stop:1741 length:651 start_codon:yes stop_codon:yes gene_type:complete